MPNPKNKTIWTAEMECFLRLHIDELTNRQLADQLGLTLTVTRMKIYELGLQRMKLVKWTRKEVKFLKDNYRSYGDVELAEILNDLGNKTIFDRRRIRKKRGYLNLDRTPQEIAAIRERNIRNKRYDMENARKARKQQHREYIRISKIKLKNYRYQIKQLEKEIEYLQGDRAPYHCTRWEIENRPAQLQKEIEALKRKIILLPDSIKKQRIHLNNRTYEQASNNHHSNAKF